MAGRGAPVILLHGYTQTSRMWRPIIPILAEKFRVIAPVLPGIGDSDIPRGDVDMTTAATRIRALAKLLGADKASVVGHDIGLMVAYAYAAQFPADVEKLAIEGAKANRRLGRDARRAQRHRPLGARGTAERDHRSADEVPVS